jgi:hypothetical protein
MAAGLSAKRMFILHGGRAREPAVTYVAVGLECFVYLLTYSLLTSLFPGPKLQHMRQPPLVPMDTRLCRGKARPPAATAAMKWTTLRTTDRYGGVWSRKRPNRRAFGGQGPGKGVRP